MKKFSKIKLTSLSKNELGKGSMGMLKGGYSTTGDCEGCSCNCGTSDPARNTTTYYWSNA